MNFIPSNIVITLNTVLKQSELDKIIAEQLFELSKLDFEIRKAAIESWQQEQIIAQESKKNGGNILETFTKNTTKKYPSVNQSYIQKAIPFLNEEEQNTLIDMLSQVRKEKIEGRIQESMAQLSEKYKVKSWLTPPVAPQELRQQVQGPVDLHRGMSNAAVQLIVFSDFSCYYCGKFVDMIKPLEKRYPENLNIVFRHSPYEDEAIKASEAAQCAADQDKFWDYHDALFATQNLSVENLYSIALQLHLDQDTFRQCLQQGTYQARVKADIEESERLSINGTPSFFVNGIQLDGLPDFNELIQLIDTEVSNS